MKTYKTRITINLYLLAKNKEQSKRVANSIIDKIFTLLEYAHILGNSLKWEMEKITSRIVR